MQFDLLRILTIMFSTNSTTLAQRIAAQSANGLFCGKLLNYDRDDFDKIVADINSNATGYSLVPMNPTSHLSYGSKQFTLLGIEVKGSNTTRH